MEAREVPAASITLDGGIISVQGTEDADVIRIDHPPIIITLGGAMTWWSDVRVTVTDAAGNLRYDDAGQPLLRYFAGNDVEAVIVNALGGNDRVENITARSMIAYGGFGNDTVQGGTAQDYLYGNEGNDSLMGWEGNDILDGGEDADILLGEDGDDLMEGTSGDDSLLGGAGNDILRGGGDKDTLGGGLGDDELVGGDGFSDMDGDDLLAGGDGNDRLHGDAGNDVLFGGDGNDGLYGGDGNDVVFGNNGNDGVYGGAGRDTLFGGAGTDRFLKLGRAGTSTNIRDWRFGETVTLFKDTTRTTTVGRPGPDLRYAPGQWADAEVAAVDAGLGWLQELTGNTRLLRTRSGGGLTFIRLGTYIPYNTADGVNDAAEEAANNSAPTFAGFNFGGGTIGYVNIATANLDQAREAVIHEVAHNWDNENPRWTRWLATSGWVQKSKPGPGQVRSEDGKWVYSENAVFASDYGKTNPMEDFATAFEALYRRKTGTLPPDQESALRIKLNFIEAFVRTLK
jgi:Ca2+-binding RTX toxin-like protein